MLQQELSASVERALLAALVYVGSFGVIIAALLTNSPHFAEVLPVSGTLIGSVSAYWFAGQATQAATQAANQASLTALTAAARSEGK